LPNLIHQYNVFEDEYEDEGMAYGRRKRFANSNLNREADFLTLTGETDFFILVMVGKKVTQVLMSIG